MKKSPASFEKLVSLYAALQLPYTHTAWVARRQDSTERCRKSLLPRSCADAPSSPSPAQCDDWYNFALQENQIASFNDY